MRSTQKRYLPVTGPKYGTGYSEKSSYPDRYIRKHHTETLTLEVPSNDNILEAAKRMQQSTVRPGCNPPSL